MTAVSDDAVRLLLDCVEDEGEAAYDWVRVCYDNSPPEAVARLVEDVTDLLRQAERFIDDPKFAFFWWSDHRPQPGNFREAGELEAERLRSEAEQAVAAFAAAYDPGASGSTIPRSPLAPDSKPSPLLGGVETGQPASYTRQRRRGLATKLAALIRRRR